MKVVDNCQILLLIYARRVIRLITYFYLLYYILNFAQALMNLALPILVILMSGYGASISIILV